MRISCLRIHLGGYRLQKSIHLFSARRTREKTRSAPVLGAHAGTPWQDSADLRACLRCLGASICGRFDNAEGHFGWLVKLVRVGLIWVAVVLLESQLLVTQGTRSAASGSPTGAPFGKQGERFPRPQRFAPPPLSICSVSGARSVLSLLGVRSNYCTV